MTRSRSLLPLPALLLLSLVIAPAVAQEEAPSADEGTSEAIPPGASTNGLWAVFPITGDGPTKRSNFTYNVEPGRAIRDDVTIANLTEEPITFLLYSADAFNAEPAGGLAVRSRHHERDSASRWLTFGDGVVEAAVTIDGLHQATVPFTLEVPADAEPGDHAGGIAALDTATEQRDEETTQLDVEHAVAAPLFVRVRGELAPSLRVEEIAVENRPPVIPGLQRGSSSVRYEIVNDGNVRLPIESTATLRGLFGREVHRFDTHEVPTLLPGGRAVVEHEWEGSVIEGRGSLEVAVIAEDVDLVRSQGFWSVPWWLLALLVVAGLATAWWRWRGRGSPKPEPDSPQLEPAEPVEAGNAR